MVVVAVVVVVMVVVVVDGDGGSGRGCDCPRGGGRGASGRGCCQCGRCCGGRGRGCGAFQYHKFTRYPVREAFGVILIDTERRWCPDEVELKALLRRLAYNLATSQRGCCNRSDGEVVRVSGLPFEPGLAAVGHLWLAGRGVGLKAWKAVRDIRGKVHFRPVCPPKIWVGIKLLLCVPARAVARSSGLHAAAGCTQQRVPW